MYVGKMDLEQLKAEQLRLARKLVLRDDFSSIKTVAGCDVAYTGKHIICTVVVMDYETLKIREHKTKVGTSGFPYIPTFLSYREAPIMIDTYHELEVDPDVLLVDGHGIIHPRRMGLASHVGLSLDKASIGIAKNLLCGQVRDDRIYLDKDILGRILQTKDKAKPIFVSQGHKISISTAIEIVKKTLRDHKLPEPLHQAHKLANRVKKKIKENHLQSL